MPCAAGPSAATACRRANPPLLGSEGVKYVIMTVRLDCSMAQAVDLPKRDMQFGTSVVPIPKVRYYARLKRQAAARRGRLERAAVCRHGRRGAHAGRPRPLACPDTRVQSPPPSGGHAAWGAAQPIAGLEALRRGPSVQPPARAAGKRARAECRRNRARQGGGCP